MKIFRFIWNFPLCHGLEVFIVASDELRAEDLFKNYFKGWLSSNLHAVAESRACLKYHNNHFEDSAMGGMPSSEDIEKEKSALLIRGDEVLKETKVFSWRDLQEGVLELK